MNERKLEPQSITPELGPNGQQALFEVLYSSLHDRTRSERESAAKYRDQWVKENQELRTLFLTIAKNLGRAEEFIARDKVGMGLVELLTEDEVVKIAENPKEYYQEQAKYLLENYKGNFLKSSQ